MSADNAVSYMFKAADACYTAGITPKAMESGVLSEMVEFIRFIDEKSYPGADEARRILAKIEGE